MTDTSADMLIRSNFDIFTESIEEYTKNEDGTIKAGLKSVLYYVIKIFAAKTMGSYLVKNEDVKANEISKFVEECLK